MDNISRLAKESRVLETLQEKKFKEHKLMSLTLSQKLRKNSFIDEAIKVQECGSFLLFSHQQHSQNSQHRLKLKKANFCKFRFCAMCQWRRSRNICRELLAALTAIESERKIAFLFLTLTAKNVETKNLKKSVKNINQSFKRMIETKAYKKAVLGHFKALEILGDHTKDNEVHPHLHCLLIVNSGYFKSRNYLSQKRFTEMWQKALRANYTPVVNIKKIRQKKGSTLTALQSAVFEVAKYCVKSSDLVSRSDEDFSSIINQTYRMRFYSSAGILKLNLKKIDEELITLDKADDELWIEIEELLYKWFDNDYRLAKKQTDSVKIS